MAICRCCSARDDECDEVVVSLFVNPTQFNETVDLATYPRDEARDAAMAADQRVDYLFAPSVSEIYPDGFATTVSVRGITEVLEGVRRGREHFEGVATIVTKLFNMVAPDVAYFGQKDAQQARVIKQLIRDLNMQVQLEVCPIVREPDGLAMSSRNALLSAADRQSATVPEQRPDNRAGAGGSRGERRCDAARGGASRAHGPARAGRVPPDSQPGNPPAGRARGCARACAGRRLGWADAPYRQHDALGPRQLPTACGGGKQYKE